MLHDLNEYFTADPKRPYKVYVALVFFFTSELLLSGVDWPDYVRAGLIAIVSTCAVYMTTNPIVSRRKQDPLT